MKRSGLTQKFMLHEWQLFEKRFREQYKKEEGSAFKGNVTQYVTIGVVQRKKMPDLEDLITLIKLGNINCTDELAEQILDGWLNDEENKNRGIAGAFCDVCKDLCNDIPVHPLIKEQVDSLENTITQMQEAMNQFNKIFEQLSSLKYKLEETKEKAEETLENNKEELGVEADTQENK